MTKRGDGVYSAEYVDNLIAEQKAQGIPLQEIAWNAALACVGWAYVYGARGQNCTPAYRRQRYSEEHPTIKEACQNFNGDKTCSGCKWYPGGKRTRVFDCRGFTYWVLKAVYGWELMGGTTVYQWANADNWKAKGTIDTMPKDVLCCLYEWSNEKKKMVHTGFGLNNETIECQKGVQYKKQREAKWTHWGVAKVIDGTIPEPTPTPTPTTKPTLRKGDRGEYVTLAQTELIRHGYSVGDSGADGVFGNNTEKAVKRFQQENVGQDGKALVVDGVIGQQTWWALDQTEIPLYTVTIPYLSKHHAEALVTNYSGAYMTPEERG